GGGVGVAEVRAVVLVPVPAAPARRRARGFDPARVLTVALARRTELPLADCLVRGDRTARQVGAGSRERRAPGRLLVRVRGGPPRGWMGSAPGARRQDRARARAGRATRRRATLRPPTPGRSDTHPRATGTSRSSEASGTRHARRPRRRPEARPWGPRGAGARL